MMSGNPTKDQNIEDGDCVCLGMDRDDGLHEKHCPIFKRRVTQAPTSNTSRLAYCKCAFTDPDGTFVPGEVCAIHPDVKPQREALTSNQRLADVPRDVLLGKTLRQRAHELRIEACGAWSDVVQLPLSGPDAAKCDYAKSVEDRLRAVIDELADLSSPVETKGLSSTRHLLERAVSQFSNDDGWLHDAKSFLWGDTPPVEPEALTESEQLLQAWADPLPPNGDLYWVHVDKARKYFKHRGAKETSELCGDSLELNGVKWRCTKQKDHHHHDRKPEKASEPQPQVPASMCVWRSGCRNPERCLSAGCCQQIADANQ